MLKESSHKLVLSICDISPSWVGSFEEFLAGLTNELSHAGFEHMIIFREKPTKDVEEALLNLGAKLKIIKPSRYNIYNFVTFYNIIKEVRPDIVHFHFYPIYTVVNYLKFIFDVKIVYTDHMGGRKTRTKLKKLLRRVYYYMNFKFFDLGIDRIICVSNFVKSKYSLEYDINSRKLVVIFNGINVDKFRKNEETNVLKKMYDLKNEFLITCVGLRRDKGPHYLMLAAPLVIKEMLDVKFVFVGEGECKNHLEHMVDILKIRDKVIFAGKFRDMSDIFSISSVVVIPSIFEEAFCFVAAEAMAAECPVVAFDSGAIKEVLYDSNFIVSKDYKLFADKIVESLKSEINTGAAKKYVMDNFSLNQNISEHLHLYNNLLSK